MSSATLIRYGGLAAIFAGVLRASASFIPYSQPTTALELLYVVIDVLIVLGLIGVYGYQREKTGWWDRLGLLLTLIGIAIIRGRAEWYAVGAPMVSFGFSLLAIGSWKTGRLPRVVSALWLLSTVVGVGGYVVKAPDVTFVIAGVAFGLGLIMAGISIWSAPASASPAVPGSR